MALIDDYSKEQLEAIVQQSASMADLLRKLGYRTQYGNNRITVQKRLEEDQIQIQHFKKYQKGRTLTYDDVFCNDSTVTQSQLRRFYKKIPQIPYRCVNCGIGDTWQGKPIVLQLDHKNGDNKNNELSNLRWLCPNCHSQTNTYAAKNMSVEKKHNYCIDCGAEISASAKRCKSCNDIFSAKNCADIDGIIRNLYIYEGSFEKVAKIYNVSAKTIRKHCGRNGYPTNAAPYKKPKAAKPRNDSNKPQKINQIDMITGEIVASYESIAEAQRQTGATHIYSASNPDSQRRSAGGYYWVRV